MGRVEEIRERTQSMITALTRCHLTSAENKGFRICEGCPFEDSPNSTCANELGRKGIALLKDAVAMIDRLTAERDAAVEDLKIACQIGEVCATCRWCCNRGDQFPCDKHGDWCGGVSWKWRGVEGKAKV